MSPLVSVVIPVHDETRRNVAMTIASVSATRTTGNVTHEVIVVDDGSSSTVRVPPGVRLIRTAWRGAAAARNAGAAVALGRYVAFLDAHCLVQSDWLTRLLRARRTLGATLISPAIYDVHDRNAIGFGQTLAEWDLSIDWLAKRGHRPYEIPLAPGACMLLPREQFFALGGFDDGLWPWGYEDIELSLRAWLAGRVVGLDPETYVGHVFRKAFPYEVRNERLARNAYRVACGHFSPDHIQKSRAALCRAFGVDGRSLKVAAAGAFAQRARWDANRVHRDEWFLRQFGITI